jgi:hypothetical protein
MRTRIRYALKICSDAADWPAHGGYAPGNVHPKLVNPDGTPSEDTLATMPDVFDLPPSPADEDE